MSKELDLILEYERARREISILKKEIITSICANPHDYASCNNLKCLNPIVKNGNVHEPCITAVWEYNKLDSDYKDEIEEPYLCESCRITQSLVDQRKAAKKRFGIAKMRISRFASGYLSSVGVD